MPELDRETLTRLTQAFMGESDRACAILCGELLNEHLRALLSAAAVQPIDEAMFRVYGPLSEFKSRIDIAYYFGLVPADERADLHAVRGIRNLFAHRLEHDLSFGSPTIADRTRNLKLAASFVSHHGWMNSSTDTMRNRFQVGVGILSFILRRRTEKVAATTKRAGPIVVDVTTLPPTRPLEPY